MKNKFVIMDDDFANDDITFCSSECANTDCFRHPSHIKIKNIPHSFALFDCEKRIESKGDKKQ